MRSTILAADAYGIYNLQMKRYSRACGSYQDFGIEDTVNTEATETRVPVGKGEIITSKMLRLPP
jgi:hypothetical protein